MKLKQIAFLLLTALPLFSVKAQETNPASDIKVWPGSADAQAEKVFFRSFLPPSDKASGRAVLILPGGGYSGLAFQHEGYDWAPFFNERGIAAFVLHYRMPGGHYEWPREDVNQALKIIREHAGEWHINPDQIGIMGSSAGGHLAASTSTLNPDGEKPAFQILFYPVISMEKEITHQGSRNNLLGMNPSEELVNRYSCEKQVTSTTPRAFIVLSDDDTAVIPDNSIQYYQALHKTHVPSSLHIYPIGGHGWGFHTNFKYHPNVLSELDSWLLSF